MKKLLTGIVAGVATITLGASCVLAATQFNEGDLAKGNDFPICYLNCELNYVDNNEKGGHEFESARQVGMWEAFKRGKRKATDIITL